MLNILPFRRIRIHQMPDEEVVALVLAVILAHGVARSRNDYQLKVFIGLDQRIDHLHRGSRVYVVIHFPHDQHERTGQQMGVLYV